MFREINQESPLALNLWQLHVFLSLALADTLNTLPSATN